MHLVVAQRIAMQKITLFVHKKATNGGKQNDCFASPFTRDMVKCLLGPLAWTAS